jgi:low molecular weight protein-tyrosine phosphatase
VRRVEIVCTGNICRSPMAAVVLRAKLAAAGVEDVEVTSSGTGTWHAGDPMDDRAAAALARRGYDGSDHLARQFDETWFGERDLILGMDSGHVTVLARRAGPSYDVIEAYDVHDVADPYYGADADFDTVLDQIEEAADVWVKRLTRR